MTVPVSRCLSTAGVRFLAIVRPLGGWAFLAVGLPGDCARTPTGSSRFTRARCGRGGCPLYPGAAVLSRPASGLPVGAAAFQRPVLDPAPTTHLRGFR